MIGMRICYALAVLSEAIIAYLYFDCIFSKKNHLFTLVVTLFLGYLVLFGLSLFNNPIINISSFFVITLGLLLVNYDCTYKNALIHVALLTFLMTLSDLFSNLIIGVFGHAFIEFTQSFAAALPMAIISKLLYLLLSFLTAHIFISHTPKIIESKRMGLLCIFPIISVGIAMLICYLGMHTLLTEATQIMIVVNMLSLLVMNLVFLILSNHLQAANAERTALQLSLLREEANTAYYRATQEQTEKHQVLLHDIKNHIGVIQALAEEDHSNKIRSYLSELEYTFLASAEIPRMSSDPILNTILLHTSQSCKEHHISFDCDVRVGCTSSMDAVDITSLYGNLLSNAVEAAMTSKKKIIELSAICNYAQNTVIISVVNSCDKPPIPDGKGSWLSIKNARDIHGVGLKSIDRILKKHSGVSKIYYDEEQHLFHHLIHLPIDRNNGQI